MEANLDRGEIITKQSSDELLGDTLLQAEYSISNEQKLKSRSGFKIMNESIVLDRPITPSHLRQSVMLQTKPFNPSDISHLDINQTGLFKNSKSTNNRLQGFDKKNSFNRISIRLSLPNTYKEQSCSLKAPRQGHLSRYFLVGGLLALLILMVHGQTDSSFQGDTLYTFKNAYKFESCISISVVKFDQDLKNFK